MHILSILQTIKWFLVLHSQTSIKYYNQIFESLLASWLWTLSQSSIWETFANICSPSLDELVDPKIHVHRDFLSNQRANSIHSRNAMRNAIIKAIYSFRDRSGFRDDGKASNPCTSIPSAATKVNPSNSFTNAQALVNQKSSQRQWNNEN